MTYNTTIVWISRQIDRVFKHDDYDIAMSRYRYEKRARDREVEYKNNLDGRPKDSLIFWAFQGEATAV
jgi:hypothetical protein